MLLPLLLPRLHHRCGHWRCCLPAGLFGGTLQWAEQQTHRAHNCPLRSSTRGTELVAREAAAPAWSHSAASGVRGSLAAVLC